MTNLIHPTEGRVFACGDCGAAALYRREWREGGVRTTNDDCLRCGECDAAMGLRDVQERVRAGHHLTVGGEP